MKGFGAISFASALVLAAALGACSKPVAIAAGHTADDPAAHQAFQNYLAAINSNDVETLAADLTDDVVYQAPHAPEMVGKSEVKPWLATYFGAYKTTWDKRSNEFVVAGDWAFERYSYKSIDTPKSGGTPLTDTGKGLLIYHHDADGKWRVARDAWSTDLPVPTK